MFRVGEKVKLIKHTNCTNGFQEGQIYEITKTNCGGVHRIKISNGDFIGFVNEEDIQKIQFTKSDLKDGDVVTYRDGKKATVLRGQSELRSIDQIGLMYLKDYDERLKYVDNKKYDIIKVEHPVQYETVYERKEEILDEAEKRYLRGVIRPFRSKVEGIEKHIRIFDSDKAFIRILSNGETMACLPDFEVDTMYKRMEAERDYTLEELRNIKE